MKYRVRVSLLMALVIALLFSVFTSCDLDTSVEVRYEVTASESVYRVTISTAGGGTGQFSDVALPWTYEFTAEEGDFVYVSAGGYGTVTVTIYLDGKVYRTTTSIGSPVIATASGSA
jgi:hypothetical protein